MFSNQIKSPPANVFGQANQLSPQDNKSQDSQPHASNLSSLFGSPNQASLSQGPFQNNSSNPANPSIPPIPQYLSPGSMINNPASSLFPSSNPNNSYDNNPGVNFSSGPSHSQPTLGQNPNSATSVFTSNPQAAKMF